MVFLILCVMRKKAFQCALNFVDELKNDIRENWLQRILLKAVAVISFDSEFEHLARSVIDECHAKQKEKAMMLAERKSPSWSEMTSLQIAASGKNMVCFV